MRSSDYIFSIKSFSKLRASGLMLTLALLFAVTQFSTLDHSHAGSGPEVSCSVCILGADSSAVVGRDVPTVIAQAHTEKGLQSEVSSPVVRAFSLYAARAPPFHR